MDRRTTSHTDTARLTVFVCIAASTMISADSGIADSLDQLAALYYDCSGRALHQVMNEETAASCADVYLRLKLEIYGGPNYAEFQRLPIAERAEVNTAAYRAFKDWASRMSMAAGAAPRLDQLE